MVANLKVGVDLRQNENKISTYLSLQQRGH